MVFQHLKRILSFLVLATPFLFFDLSAATPENVLLVINSNSSESVEIGDYYRRKRGIPEANICRIQAITAESISRSDFQLQILEPLAGCLRSRQLQDQILYIVTTRGLPLYVEGDPGPVGDLASVDSELTLLYRYLVYDEFPTYGRLENPYFANDFGHELRRPFKRSEQDIYLVTRIAAASLADAIFLINSGDSRTEGGLGERTFLFDLPSQKSTVVGDWIEEAARRLKEGGLSVQVEKTAAVVSRKKAVAGYATFGSLDPNLKEVPVLEWTPGAIALILAPDSVSLTEDSLAGQIVRQGASAIGCYVGDPGADGFIRPQILYPAYEAGHSLAESFYLASRYLGWRQVIVSDPLSAPYRQEGLVVTPDDGLTIDSETGLPQHFSERRERFLTHKYSTSKEAVQFLLRAEHVAARGDEEKALELLDGSLSRDPFIGTAHLLKARLLEARSRFQEAVHHYQRALELGQRGRTLYTRLAKLALYELSDPEMAEPYAAWLFSRDGLGIAETAALWAAVQWKNGNLEEAEGIYYQLHERAEAPSFWLLAALGRLYLEKGNLDLAEEFLKAALESDPTVPDAIAPSVPFATVSSLQESLQNLQKQRASETEDQAADSPGEPADGTDPEETSRTRPAQVVRRVSAEYPDAARARGIEGPVVIQVLVDERGQAVKIRSIHGKDILRKAAEKAIEQWQFAPKLVNGRGEPSWLTVTINFVITEP